MRFHEDELMVTDELVRSLVEQQFPGYAGLQIEPLSASGSSNIQFRLGSDLLLRFPRQPDGGKSIRKEQRWSPLIADHLPVSVPEIVALGKPGEQYAESWAVVRWLEGEHPAWSSNNTDLALELADVLLAFRGIEIDQAIADAPDLRAAYRGKALGKHDPWFHQSVEACRSIPDLDLDLDAALTFWNRSMKLPGAFTRVERESWFHGDIVAENLLLNSGSLSTLLDLGGLSIGDPTIDLHGAWELFDADARQVFRHRLGVDDATWLRGRAWALAVAMMTFAYYWRTMPQRIESRLVMARAVLADPE